MTLDAGSRPPRVLLAERTLAYLEHIAGLFDHLNRVLTRAIDGQEAIDYIKPTQLHTLTC